MLIEEYMSIIEAAPRAIQQAVTQIKQLEMDIAAEKNVLDREIEVLMEKMKDTERPPASESEIDMHLSTINKCYIKMLDAERKKLYTIRMPQKRLEDVLEMMKDTSAEFRETVAKDTLGIKIKGITELLECVVEEHIEDTEQRACCTCQKPEKGEMIVCKNADCAVQWYHCACVGLKAVPRKKWVCPMCDKHANEKE